MLGGLKQASVLAVASVALLQLVPGAQAGERMQLGVQIAPGLEFQTQVGDRVFFSDGSAALGTRARSALEAQAAWLKRHSGFSVTIEGHADDAGAAAHNQDVSWRRAEAVRRQLIESGVAAKRIFIVAYGRDRLIAECTEPGCAAQNRRVVTVLGEPDAASSDWPGVPGQEPGDTAARRSPRRLY